MGRATRRKAAWQAALTRLNDAHLRPPLALEAAPEKRSTLMELILSGRPVHEAHPSRQLDYLKGLRAGK